MVEDLIKLVEKLLVDGGWFSDFFKIIFAITLVLIAIIYLYRFSTGKSDLLGRSKEEGEQAKPSVKNLEEQIKQLQTEKLELEKKAESLNEETNRLNQMLNESTQLYEELDEKYADETYFMSQIMYTKEEVNLAMANRENFYLNRDDIYKNLFDYLVNTIKGFREKRPRVVIHVRHPEKPDRLIHYAHSSGHSHRVREYEPLIDESAAGRAWRTNQIYYIPDIEAEHCEYDRKVNNKKYYRSILCVPLKAGDDKSLRIGVLSVTGEPANAYESIEIDRIVLFASLIYPLVYLDVKQKEVSLHG